MRQILSNLRSGATTLADIPAPHAGPGEILIRTRRSLVSLGTEKMLVQFGKASLFQKARSQPERVKQVLAKMRTEGVMPTIDAVFRRLDEPLPLGYCNAGVVVGVGNGISGFAIGDRVASNGPHAELVAVPANLVAKIPEGVSDEAAAFTVVGAIGLQGLRLAAPELGETFVVIGLGLIGQITAQLLRAAGCRVIGVDFDEMKVGVARKLGVEAVAGGRELDIVRHVLAATSGLGADGVIITASTSSHDVIAQAAHMSRKRGRIILIGVVGLNLNRADFYEKELTFRVSCSYGPGRYDDAYEEKGHDYPAGFVRWTENRNFQAVLQAMVSGALRVDTLITRQVPIEGFAEIYENLDDAGLASLLVYPDSAAPEAVELKLTDSRFAASDGALAVIGAGNFTKMTALPALHAASARVKTIISAGGVTGTALARKYGVAHSGTDFSAVLADSDIRGVIITTRHQLHAAQTVAALAAGKHVLVEKPLCLLLEELEQIEATISRVGKSGPAPTLTVGFNRRFSPHIAKMKELLGENSGAISLVATMNAGFVPPGHWVHDPEVGGGRLIGEACHFVDLAIHLAGSPVVAVSATAVGEASDSASILLRHANGSTAVINYFAHGHRDVPKERLEVHSQGRSLLLDNFCELRGHGFRSFSKSKTAQDKGHARQFALFAERVRSGGAALIAWSELANSTRATLAIPRAIVERRWIEI
jgi:predicted dehydrogenase/threonine dehydrogenase-like Zn-dependent dehydrogenase